MTKVRKVIDKGVVLLAQYMGKLEKYILLKMEEYRPPNSIL